MRRLSGFRELRGGAVEGVGRLYSAVWRRAGGHVVACWMLVAAVRSSNQALRVPDVSLVMTATSNGIPS